MKQQLKDILERAKKCPNKGRLYVYESYKRELEALNLTTEEYGEACRQLARFKVYEHD